MDGIKRLFRFTAGIAVMALALFVAQLVQPCFTQVFLVWTGMAVGAFFALAAIVISISE